MSRNRKNILTYSTVHPILHVTLSVLGLNTLRYNVNTGSYALFPLFIVTSSIMLLINCIFIPTFTIGSLLVSASETYTTHFFTIYAAVISVQVIVTIVENIFYPFYRQNYYQLQRSFCKQNVFDNTKVALMWMAYVPCVSLVYIPFGFDFESLESAIGLVFLLIFTYITPAILDYQFIVLLKPLAKFKCHPLQDEDYNKTGSKYRKMKLGIERWLDSVNAVDKVQCRLPYTGSLVFIVTT